MSYHDFEEEASRASSGSMALLGFVLLFFLGAMFYEASKEKPCPSAELPNAASAASTATPTPESTRSSSSTCAGTPGSVSIES